MDEVERGHCSGRFQVDISKTAALYHFPFVKDRFYLFIFASLPIYVILSVHSMLVFGLLTNENGMAIL